MVLNSLRLLDFINKVRIRFKRENCKIWENWTFGFKMVRLVNAFMFCFDNIYVWVFKIYIVSVIELFNIAKVDTRIVKTKEKKKTTNE